MKNKRLLLTMMLALACFVGGGVKVWAYDFSQTEEHGQTLYYTITSAVEPYTVKVTYPYEEAQSGSQAYGTYSSPITKPSGAITIPATVTNETITYTVTAIDKWAFYSCSNVTSVSLPNSITTIGEYAFNGCSKLEGITIPNSVTTINNNAFNSCSNNKFTDITIPNSVTTIGNNAFDGCSKVTSLSIGTGITTLATGVFKGLNSLTSVTLPSNITTIQNNAFQNCSQVTTIEGPGVTTLVGTPFASCSNLTTINFPVLVSIQDKAFNSCTSLESVTIPSTVTSISGNPFYGCSSLATITVDPANTIYTSGDGANCIINKTNNQLLTGCLGTTIPEGVVKINDNAFYNYSGLTSINIPNTVTQIGGNAFYGCKLASLTLPEGLTTIGSSAFAYNNTLTSVIIPSTVTTIQSNAFQYCTSLTSVIVLRESSIPSLSTNVFYKNYSSIIDGLTIYVPSNKVSDYESATNWKNYASNINDDGVLVYKSAGDWTTAANWSTEPAASADVYIIANCTIPTSSAITVTNMYIPNGVTLTINNGAKLTATNINNIGGSESLVIADGGQLICNNAVEATVKKDINHWTTGDPVGGWYFIASPVDNNALDPEDVENMITDDNEDGGSRTYDLYSYDATTPWYNYRAHSNDFVLANGQGYLYANEADVILGLSGTTKPYSEVNHANKVAVSAGWNLVGNPYTFNTFVNQNYYTLNSGRTGVIAVTDNAAIAPCTGILVDAEEAGYVTFSNAATPSLSKGNIELALAQATRGGATLDNAIVSFGEGNELKKFYFMQQDANLYIPQGAEEYAIVSSNGQGEMPVNFRANEDGQYTLTVSTEGVEMNYLHLIDNMTGADVDLLATNGGDAKHSVSTYTFNAKTTDYESRFKLVFAANSVSEAADDDNDAPFAFVSNGEIILVGVGADTCDADTCDVSLQVIDMQGRVLIRRDAPRASAISTNGMAPGVYVLRLISGEKVRTQKIVVR